MNTSCICLFWHFSNSGEGGYLLSIYYLLLRCCNRGINNCLKFIMVIETLLTEAHLCSPCAQICNSLCFPSLSPPWSCLRPPGLFSNWQLADPISVIQDRIRCSLEPHKNCITTIKNFSTFFLYVFIHVNLVVQNCCTSVRWNSLLKIKKCTWLLGTVTVLFT